MIKDFDFKTKVKSQMIHKIINKNEWFHWAGIKTFIYLYIPQRAVGNRQHLLIKYFSRHEPVAKAKYMNRFWLSNTANDKKKTNSMTEIKKSKINKLKLF